MRDHTDRMEKNEPPRIYSALTIADWFIDKGVEAEGYVDLLKLQKLVFLSFGWFWAFYKRDLFDDQVQAWKYGPVIPVVFFAYRAQGEIVRKRLGVNETTKLVTDEDAVELLTWTHHRYEKCKSWDLVEQLHAKGTPWDEEWDGSTHKEIRKHLIRNYYEELLEKNEANWKEDGWQG